MASRPRTWATDFELVVGESAAPKAARHGTRQVVVRHYALGDDAWVLILVASVVMPRAVRAQAALPKCICTLVDQHR